MESSTAASKPSVRRARRLAVLVVLGVLLAGGVAGYRYYWLARPVGEGPAGPAVDSAPFARVWSDRKVLVLGLGDSVTAGFGVPTGYGYVDRLVDNPADEWPDMKGRCLRRVFPNIEVRNMAISGSTSLTHLAVIERDLPEHDRDTLGLVVMTTGGNDLIHSYGQRPPREGAMYGATLQQARPWIEAFEKRLNRMLDLIEERFPGGCHVFLADIYDPSDGVGDPPSAGLPPWPDCMAILAAYNEIIHRAAEKRPNVYVVPMHAAFLGHGVHAAQFWREHYRADDPYYWFGVNLEDPNIRGYDAIRRLFLNEMAEALAGLDVEEEEPQMNADER